MPVIPINYDLYKLLWNKYKPALVKLMVDSKEEPQEYQFISHEFRDLNPKEKGGHAFTLEAHRGRPQNNIKMSVVAQDLISILAKSAKAQELMELDTYVFVMNKQFLLTITHVPAEVVEEESEEVVAESAEVETPVVAETKVEEVAVAVEETPAAEEAPEAEVKEEVEEAKDEAPVVEEVAEEEVKKEPKAAAKPKVKKEKVS